MRARKPTVRSDLYPVQITIENIYCFRDKSTVPLEANAYAIFAAAEDNPARSNWLGKSTLLMCFAFALFGWHTKRTDDEIIYDRDDEDREASVELLLSDGSIIKRSKAKGKPIQLTFTLNGKVQAQALAQEAIERHIGFTKDDFFMVVFFEQNKIGELVRAKSSARLEIVENWFASELAPIQRVNEIAVARLAKARQRRTELYTQKTSLTESYDQLLAENPDPAETIGELDLAIASKREELNRAMTARAAAMEIEKKREKAAEYGRVIEIGLAKRAEFDAIPADAEEQKEAAVKVLATADLKLTETRTKEAQLKSKVFKFDGSCPVVCQECPSRAWVASHATAPAALAAATQARQEAATAQQAATSAVSAARQAASRRQALGRELDQLRTRAKGLAEVVEEVEEAEANLDEGAISVDDCRAELEGLVAQRSRLDEALKAMERSADKVKELDAEIAAIEDRLDIATAAAVLTGRTGAQQAIQEIMLAQISEKANRLLADADIDLSISISWEQPTKDLAKVCDRCGAAFPASRKVRQCQCGAERGNQVQRKLMIDLSNRSGAAEDLAGIALGIAAGLWLKGRRGSSWGTVFIDEPFGSLDRHNRTALGAHLSTMLRTVYSSSFVVAHETALLDAMPGKIQIVSNGIYSEVS